MNMEKLIGLLEETLYKELSINLLEALKITLDRVKESGNVDFIIDIRNVIDKAEQILK